MLNELHAIGARGALYRALGYREFDVAAAAATALDVNNDVTGLWNLKSRRSMEERKRSDFPCG